MKGWLGTRNGGTGSYTTEGDGGKGVFILLCLEVNGERYSDEVMRKMLKIMKLDLQYGSWKRGLFFYLGK